MLDIGDANIFYIRDPKLAKKMDCGHMQEQVFINKQKLTDEG